MVCGATSTNPSLNSRHPQIGAAASGSDCTIHRVLRLYFAVFAIAAKRLGAKKNENFVQFHLLVIFRFFARRMTSVGLGLGRSQITKKWRSTNQPTKAVVTPIPIIITI